MIWAYVYFGIGYACICLLALMQGLTRRQEQGAARAFLLTPAWPLVVLWLLCWGMVYVVHTALGRDRAPREYMSPGERPVAPGSGRKPHWRSEPPVRLPSTLKGRR